MTVITVDHAQGAWKAIPRALMDDNRLSLAARGFMGWILVKPENWTVRPEFCKATFGLSDERWSKLTKELIDAGYYHRQTVRGERGRVTTRVTITPTASPPPQKPVPGETGTRSTGHPDSRVPGDPGHLNKNLESKNLTNNNNQAVVVFEDDILRTGLLNKREQDQTLAILGTVDESIRQLLADELAGALRVRGRKSERSIKNPARFLSSILTVSPDQLTYASDEADLRVARAAARAREALSTPSRTLSKTSLAGTKPPPDVLKRFAQIRADHMSKDHHVR